MTAFIVYGIQITWEGVVIALGCAAAFVVGAILRSYQRKSVGEYLACAVFCAVAAILGSRLMYFYCSTELYSSFWEVLTLRDAGQSLGGAILGAAAAMLIFGIFVGFKKLPALFDSICTAGILAIFVGRLAGFFNSSDRGRMIFTNPFFQRFPFAVELEVGSELTEWRFATFFCEALCGALIFVVCASFFAKAYELGAAKNEGSAALMVCALFGASQAVLESTRYDSLFMSFNGFVSVVQILCALILVLALVFAFARYIKIGGSKGGAIASLLLSLLLIGCAGVLEYLVQRYAKFYPLWYSLMTMALGFAALLICRMLARAVAANNEKRLEQIKKRMKKETAAQ